MALDIQEGDVKLFNTLDGGDVTVADGLINMSPGLDTAVYLSLFGGNQDDNTNAGNPLTWWGNIGEVEARQYRSSTQYLLRSLPLTTGNLIFIQEAVEQDLKWMLDNNIASEIEVEVTIPQLNRVKIDIAIDAQGLRNEFNFTENWEASV